MRNLRKEFGAARVNREDMADFEGLIAAQFTHGSYPTRQVIFRHDGQGEPALSISFTRAGDLANIESGPALTDDDIREIRERLEREFFAAPTWSVGRAVAFANAPVRGHYRHGDRWQILPVPEQAPRPGYIMAPHPFLVEYKFRSSDAVWVRGARAARAQQEISCLLAGLLVANIRFSSTTLHEWIIGEEATNYVSRLGQRGYVFDATGLPAGNFSDVSGVKPLPETDTQTYYAEQFITVDAVMRLPEDFGRSIDRFEELSPAQRSQYLRACYWAKHAQEISRDSASAALVAAVSVVEALGPAAEVREICDRCQQVMGATALFNDTLSTLVPGADVRKERFYQLRSELVHGRGLLLRELDGWSHSTKAMEEDQRQRAMLSLLPFALHNWLDPDVRIRVEQLLP